MAIRNLAYSLALFLLVILLQGCASRGYNISPPVPSALGYAAPDTPSPGDLVIRDRRGSDPQYFSFGVLPAELRLDGVAFDPVEFLRLYVDEELRARKIDSSVSPSGEVVLEIKSLRMRNHRTNGYTPFITLTMLSADVMTEGGPERIAVYISRGKVPVWSFAEVIEPIFTQPMDLLVKELVAKLNRIVYGQRLTDDAVRQLIQKIEAGPIDGRTYLDVYQLGFGNNATAIPVLAEWTQHESEYVRLAAISSLGTLQAVEHFDLLCNIQEETTSWSDRAMAIKAIGDLGTPDSLAYLKALQRELEMDPAKESKWNVEIMDLYLWD